MPSQQHHTLVKYVVPEEFEHVTVSCFCPATVALVLGAFVDEPQFD